jgi:glycosyltransferase involved in cell wall biosynthesis
METKSKILKKPNVGVVCLSHEMKREFLTRYPFLEGRIIVIPNPVDSDIFFPLLSKEHTQVIPKLIYLGGFTDKRKGYDLLLEALKECEERFDLIATGFTGEALTGKFGQVRIVGTPRIRNETSMNEFLNQADLTVVPSRQEALPQVATESLMAGTPVVSFSVGGLADIVLDGKTGLKVAPFDISELAKAIDFSIKNDLKKYLPTRKFALEKFSRNKIVWDYISFSKRLLQ